MRIFVCTNHDGHYPIGVASVVIAKDRRQAKKLLDEELKSYGLKASDEKSYNLSEVSTKQAKAIILHDGDYY